MQVISEAATEVSEAGMFIAGSAVGVMKDMTDDVVRGATGIADEMAQSIARSRKAHDDWEVTSVVSSVLTPWFGGGGENNQQVAETSSITDEGFQGVAASDAPMLLSNA